MTPEQRKRVAEIINGYEHKYDGDDLIGKYNRFLWHPEFDADSWQRSQALAVVKWVAGYIASLIDILSQDINQAANRVPELSCTLVDCINDGDIESLLSLVLELSDEM